MSENNGAVVKSGKRRFRIIAVVFLVLAVGFVGLYIHAGSRLDRKLDEIRAAGFPVSLEELDDWYSIPEGAENAADIYVEAFDMYYSPDYPDDLPVFGNVEETKPGEKIPAETITLMEGFLADNEEALGLLRETAKIENCRYPVDFSKGVLVLMPDLGKIKKCTQMLHLKAILDTENGRADLVVEDIEVGMAIADSLKKEPTLISMLVRTACLALTVQSCEYAVNRVEFDDQQLLQMTDLLAEVEGFDMMSRALAGERAVMIDYIQHPSDYSGVMGTPQIGTTLYSMTGLNKSGLIKYLDIFNETLGVLHLPMHERNAAMAVVEEKMMGLPWYHAFIRQTSSALVKINQLDLRAKAHYRCGVVGLAVERYRLAKGHLPERLDEIVPEYLDTIPLDPFDGEEIRYKRLDKGYVVYSVGSDLTDNAGEKRTKENRETGYDEIFKVER